MNFTDQLTAAYPDDDRLPLMMRRLSELEAKGLTRVLAPCDLADDAVLQHGPVAGQPRMRGAGVELRSDLVALAAQAQTGRAFCG
ncbi:MAG: hypothetical protein EOP87_09350, partial [Verrucomicrobiaceae bacterium]